MMMVQIDLARLQAMLLAADSDTVLWVTTGSDRCCYASERRLLICKQQWPLLQRLTYFNTQRLQITHLQLCWVCEGERESCVCVWPALPTSLILVIEGRSWKAPQPAPLHHMSDSATFPSKYNSHHLLKDHFSPSSLSFFTSILQFDQSLSFCENNCCFYCQKDRKGIKGLHGQLHFYITLSLPFASSERWERKMEKQQQSQSTAQLCRFWFGWPHFLQKQQLLMHFSDMLVSKDIYLKCKFSAKPSLYT